MEEKIFIKHYLSKQPELQKELLEQMFSQENPFTSAFNQSNNAKTKDNLLEFEKTATSLLQDLQVWHYFLCFKS
ncbi:MAG: hypothetical protein IJU86_00250, partial [Firmicutes bacterium]|nr:hypothetical protein [Bacillota bacterium]